FRELEPGARVISHNFGMGDWEADTVVTVTAPSGTSSAIRLWVLPADVAGTWELELSAGGTRRRYQVRFEQRYQRITGTASLRGRTVAVTAARLRGNRLAFALADSGGAELRLEGEVEAGMARGTGWQAWRR
ncbi:MAG: hypothetical protein ACREOF_16075, partial [Gemmatimonadales bacterium]